MAEGTLGFVLRRVSNGGPSCRFGLSSRSSRSILHQVEHGSETVFRRRQMLGVSLLRCVRSRYSSSSAEHSAGRVVRVLSPLSGRATRFISTCLSHLSSSTDPLVTRVTDRDRGLLDFLIRQKAASASALYGRLSMTFRRLSERVRCAMSNGLTSFLRGR